MNEKKKKVDDQVIEGVETLLQTKYSENEDFNIALNGEDPIEFKSLKEPNENYKFEISEVLFWVDRKAYQDELEFWKGEQVKNTHNEAINYLKESDQLATFNNLVEAMKKGRIVPFVGAGLSIPCGYSQWSIALEKIADRLQGIDLSEMRIHLDNCDYLSAAQVLYDAEPLQVENFIRTEYSLKYSGDGRPAILGAVLLLPQISNGCVVTTNFDDVIEQVFKKDGKPLDGYMHGTQKGNNFVQRLLKGDHCILKLHGNSADRNSHVFTQNQYINAYGDPLDFNKQLPRALRQIYIGHSLLFLGCSLHQDKTLDLFKHVKKENQFDIPDHFAFLPKPENPREILRKENRLLELEIHPIWYQPDEQHSFVEQYLKLAVSKINQEIQFG